MTIRRVCAAAALAAATFTGMAVAGDAAPRAYIVSPAAGATVPSTFTVQFGLHGMGVAPAGVKRSGTGHHHLLIDVAELPPLDKPLPATDKIRHFGGGQTEVTLTLAPGTHTLQLVMGDHGHVPHDPPVVSERITIHVGQ